MWRFIHIVLEYSNKLSLYWLSVSYQPIWLWLSCCASSYNGLENNFHVCERSEFKKWKKCFTFLIECLMAFKFYQTRPNTIKHDQTGSNITKQGETVKCLVTKQCLMVFGRQSFIVYPGPKAFFDENEVKWSLISQIGSYCRSLSRFP